MNIWKIFKPLALTTANFSRLMFVSEGLAS
uniref:Uncharacterized protein n=1 Tax=Rhizophora mucronata TaxID=61149 RepID=A0A2P2QX07_RHIMU